MEGSEQPKASRAASSRRGVSDWWSSLTRAAKVIVAVAGGVTALAAAAGGVIKLWPKPEPVRSADFSAISVDQNVTLEEFTSRHAEGTALAPSRPGRVRLVAYRVAQAPEAPADAQPAPDAEIPAGAAGDDQTTPGGATGSTAPDTGMTTPSETDTEATTPAGAVQTTGQGEQVPQPTGRARSDMQEGVAQALERPSVPNVRLSGPCLDNLIGTDCGLKSMQSYLQATTKAGAPAPLEPVDLARRLASLLKQMRMQKVGAAQEPVGVTVNFKLSTTGLRGRKVDVRWWLFDASRIHHIPPSWLASQRAMLMQPAADNDTVSGDVWLPLPRVKGDFFVRLAVFSEDGTRVTYADSPHVR